MVTRVLGSISLPLILFFFSTFSTATLAQLVIQSTTTGYYRTYGDLPSHWLKPYADLLSHVATGKLVTSIAAGTKKDVDLAVDAAKKVIDRD
jgi:hypothetical protein